LIDLVTLETTALAYRGGAVARDSEGKVVFVRGAAPDEVVEARRVRRRSRFDLAELVRVLRPSPHRVEPFCPLAGACGGCDWQHVSLEAQREACRRIIVDALGRAGLEIVPDAVIPSPVDRGWRHRARMHGGDRALGFFRAATHEVVDAVDCPVLAQPLCDAAAALRDLLAEVGRGVDSVMELSLADEGVLAALHLSTTPDGPDRLLRTLENTDLLRGGVLAAPGLRSRGFGEAAGTKTITLRGQVRKIPVAAGAFLQANWAANAILVERTLAAVEVLAPRNGRILELYSGSGNMTLPLLSAGFAVEAWESSGPAVQALEAAAPAAAALRLRRGDAGRALTDRGQPPDLVLLDPPRTGARAVCEALRDHPVRAAVYVSCDPNTLGRDLGILHTGGWSVERVVPLDLFPHTPHVETVTTLRRR